MSECLPRLGLLLAAEFGAMDAAARVLVADLRIEEAGAAAGAFLQLGRITGLST